MQVPLVAKMKCESYGNVFDNIFDYFMIVFQATAIVVWTLWSPQHGNAAMGMPVPDKRGNRKELPGLTVLCVIFWFSVVSD